MKRERNDAMKILLAVDGSASAGRAVAEVVATAGELRALPEIHLLHIQPPIPDARVQQHVGHGRLEAYYREQSQPHLAAAEAALTAAGLPFVRHIHVGDAAEIIAKLAAEYGCDRIVMGTNGRSALVDVVLGSVSHRVLRLAPCPVLLVK